MPPPRLRAHRRAPAPARPRRYSGSFKRVDREEGACLGAPGLRAAAAAQDEGGARRHPDEDSRRLSMDLDALSAAEVTACC